MKHTKCVTISFVQESPPKRDFAGSTSKYNSPDASRNSGMQSSLRVLTTRRVRRSLTTERSRQTAMTQAA